MNGVIDTATGDLKRAGYADFETDGSFDATTETVVADVPTPPRTVGDPVDGKWDRWDGAAWIEAA